MKSIVIFYSRTGNTKFIAEEIATNFEADLQPLIDKKDRSGLLGWIFAGFDAVRKKKTQIEEFDFEPGKYNVIFIGCPNWAGQMPPALRTFLEDVDLNNRKIVLFCTQDNMGAEKVFNNLRLLCKGANIIAEKYFNKVLQNKDEVRQQVREWLADLKNNKL
jgi:flavodoxin